MATLSFVIGALAFLPLATAQQIGSPEKHPKLWTETCTKRHGCKPHRTSVVLDALAHSIQDIDTGVSCRNASGGLDRSICPTEEACGESCAIEGITDYTQHGVWTRGDALLLRQYLEIDGQVTSVSPRLYLLDPSGHEYEELKLLNQELSFDVDVSNLPCGENGALYLGAMDADGGRSRLNPAGATYGTGYCDAQCPTLQWIEGVANINGSGSCCDEFDIWEANARGTAYVPHPCTVTGLYECSGDECGAEGVCDKPGCGFNPYALGAQNFYGYRKVVDTKRPFTVTTQFLTDDGTSSGTLNEIRRLYIQDGELIDNAKVTFQGGTLDSITDEFCDAYSESSAQHGGLAQMGEAIGRGMVLTFALWNDVGGYMNWLDAGNSGPCNATEGNPEVIEATNPGTSVVFSAIKWGDIDSTYRVKKHHWV